VTSRFDVLGLPDREHRRPHRPRVEHPARDRQHANEGRRARPHDSDDRDRQHDHGKCQLHVGQPHQKVIDAAAGETGQQAQHDTDAAGEHHRARGQRQRQAAAVQDTREDVAAQVVRAKRMRGGASETPRGREPLRKRGLHRIGGCQPWRGGTGGDDGDQDEATDDDHRMARQAPHP